MEFGQELQPAVLRRRYKRFLAEVKLPSGEVRTIHCPNSGSMLGCLQPGNPVLFSRAANPSRKYPHTLEMIKVNGYWVGINTCLTNRLAREAFVAGLVAEVGPVDRIEAEVRVSERSRLDFLLHHREIRTYVEVKNCTMVEKGQAMFPDAVTARGTKHLRELLRLRRAGHRAAVFFCVQRADASCFRPAAHIDPEYARTLQEVMKQGVTAMAYQAEVGPSGIRIARQLPLLPAC